MAEKNYTYYGPMSGVTLPADDAHPNGRQIQFIRGGRVTVPDDNDYIQSLVARGYLKPVAETTASTDTNTTKVSATSADASTTSPSTTESSADSSAAAATSTTASTDTSSAKTSGSTTTGTTSTTTGS